MPAGPPVQTVLFACVHNAGRSQMAAAFFGELCEPRRARALSAGTQPAARVQPAVVAVMRECGIELDGNVPRLLTPELAATADLLVTLGCGEVCRTPPGVERRDWPLADPAGRGLAEVRRVRDEVRARVAELVVELGCARRAPARK